MTTRIEHDSFGPIAVPAERLRGEQAPRDGGTLRVAALALGDVSGKNFDHRVVPGNMTGR